MYENFYHLRAKPFRLSPDPSFFFASRGHKRALAYLRYGLSQSEGFVVITGAPGTGKTTLAQILLREMGQTDVVVAHLTTTQLEADEMLRMVLASFGLRYEGQDKAALLKTLEAFFLARSREHKRVLLVVDEAQNLPARSLEELRMLSNLQVGDKALLQTFLLGQVQFRQMLDHPDLEQLRQRVIANYHLSALGEDECQSYIESRLKHVGWQNDPCFTEQAFEIIHEYTEGIPRRINMLCDRVLLFSGLEEEHEITVDVLRKVTDELQSEVSGRPIARVELSEELPDVPAVAPELLETSAPDSTTEQGGEPEAELAPEPGASQADVASSADQHSDDRAPVNIEEPVILTHLPEDSAMDRAVPDDGWNQLVAQAKPDEAEVSGDDNQLAEMERFRVIAGGREAEQDVAEMNAVRPANQPSPGVMAPLPDAPDDSQEVMLRKILRLVLAFHRSPRSFPGLDDSTQPLPKGIKAILELAIAEDHVLSGLRQIAVMGISPAMLRAAVRFFVRRVMFLPGGDDFRVLGLPSNASLTDVEIHYGLLMKLLRQDKKDIEESGIARVGDAYERLCRSDITTPPEVAKEDSGDIENLEEELDLDLSPNLGKSGNLRSRPTTAGADDIFTSNERSGLTSRNIMLITGVSVIVFILYLTQIKTTENVSPNLTAAEPEKAVAVDAPVVSSPIKPTSADLIAEAEVVAPEMAEQQSLSAAEAERAEAAAMAAAKAEEETRIAEQAKADAVVKAQATAAAKAEEEARIKAEEEARIKAEEEARIKAEEEARIKAEEEARIKAEEEARIKAVTKAEAEAKALAAAKAKEEAAVRAQAALVAKAKAAEEARVKAEAAAKAKTAAEAKAKAVASSGLINLAALNKMIAGFEAAYQAGDLNKLMQLHSPTVRTNDQIDLAGVRGKYQSLFGSTSERNIKFNNMNWEREQNYALGTGQYAVSELRKGESAAYEETGKITLQLESRSGKLQITRFYTSDSVIVKMPAVNVAEAEPASAGTNPFSRIPAEELEALLGELIRTYAAGNIDDFMNLFAKDAQTNDRATVKGIREDYVGLFNNTSFRTIAFNKMQWKWDGSVARGEGAYDVEVQTNGQTKRDHYQGQVWIQMERRDDGVRITHFAFSE